MIRKYSSWGCAMYEPQGRVNFVSSGEDIFRKPRGRGKQFLAQNVSGTKFFAIKRIRKAVQKHSNMENFLLTTIATPI